MKACMIRATRWLSCAKDLPPLFFRLALAYGFYQPAIDKLSNHEATMQAFANLGMPFPYFTAYLVGIVEALGVPLLILGLATRWISLILWAVMMVAVFGVHVPTHTDFMMPLWFALALFSLMVTGAGRYSVDRKFCFCEKALCCSNSQGNSCQSKSIKTSCCDSTSHSCSKESHHEAHKGASHGGCCRH